MPQTQFEECWPLPTESLPEFPLNLNIVFLVDCLSSGNPVHVDHASAVKKGIIKSLWVDLLCLAFLGLGEPLGTLSPGLWVIAVDPAFIAGHQSIKNCGIWIDQLDHLSAIMTTSFFLIFSEHPWDEFCANRPHLQFLANNCVYSSHTDIKLCTYCLYRHKTVLIHEILYLASQLWCSDFLTPPTPLIIPNRLPAYRSSKVSSCPDCIFEIHQPWQSGFSRVYSNSCCSYSFKPEIIKIGQSSHKMHSNNILNFQESTQF